MNKNRLEAFSDGVFAIVITLLILDVKLPLHVDYDHLGDAILAIMPKILSYGYSFIIIGLYWVSHHNISRFMVKIDRVVIWLNILLLLFVSFIPFPTSLMGEYPFKLIPIWIYGSTLLASNVTGFFIWRYVSKNYRHLNPNTPKEAIRAINKSFLFVNLFYIVAMAVSFAHVYLSYGIFFGVLVYMILFSKSDRASTVIVAPQ